MVKLRIKNFIKSFLPSISSMHQEGKINPNLKTISGTNPMPKQPFVATTTQYTRSHASAPTIAKATRTVSMSWSPSISSAVAKVWACSNPTTSYTSKNTIGSNRSSPPTKNCNKTKMFIRYTMSIVSAIAMNFSSNLPKKSHRRLLEISESSICES